MPRVTRASVNTHGQLSGVGADDHHAELHAITDAARHSGYLKDASVAALLAADVAMTLASTWYDGPSGSFAAGKWLIVAGLTAGAAGDSNFQGRLWDGTTTYASGSGNASGAGTGTEAASVSLATVVTLGGTTTVKASMTCMTAGRTLKAALIDNGVGNNASWICGYRIE